MLDIISLRNVLRKNSVACDDEQIQKLMQYSEFLREWNAKINLVSRRDEEYILERHVVHSLAPLFRFSFCDDSAILDLGTGGGLPGIPLAIVCRANRFTLVDSIQKKMTAVNDIVSRLKLANVETVTGRAEELPRQEKYLHSFAYIVSRAVAPMTELVRWGKPLLVRGEKSRPEGAALAKGTIVLYKGGDLSKERGELESALKPSWLETHSIAIDGIDPELVQEKKLVIINP